MAQKNRLLHINDYCLIEYIYSDSNAVEEQYNLSVLYNGNTNTHQVFNSDADSAITSNIQANTLVSYDKNQYVQLDEQNSILDYNKSIVKSSNIPGSIVYDKVRFHFLSGVNISLYNNLILSVRYLENDGKLNILASVGLNSVNSINLMTYNSDPIYLSDAVYDKYVEVKIPSMKIINYDYYYTPLESRGQTLGAKLTLNDVTNQSGTYSGFINSSPIQFAVDECKESSNLKVQILKDNKYILKTYTLYTVDSHVEASLPLINDYDEFTATIREVTDGNYFEYFASTEGGLFADDFINQLSIKSNSQAWVLIHQLNIYETTHYSGSKLTSSQTTYQNTGYDEVQLFRPILKNAGIDVNFKIDYTVRLLNQDTGEQIIRTASIISDNVNKYGKNTVGIKVSATPNKIYNKVYKSNSSQVQLYMEPDTIEIDALQQPGTVTFIDRIVQYPLYCDYSKISVSEVNLKSSDSVTDNKIIYKQGDLRLIIKPFDNFFKFKVYEESNGLLIPSKLDTSNVYKLTFMSNNKNGKLEYTSVTDDNTLRMANGDLLFTIPMVDAVKILMFSNREFYITSYNAVSLYEYVMYSGFWFKQSELQQYNQYISDLKVSYDIDNVNNTKIQDLINSSTTTTDIIPQDIHIPGYVDQSSKGSEKSSVSAIQPKS